MLMRNNYKLYDIIHWLPKAIRASFFCIRFPFLYPKNRFTGKHCNNWKLMEKIREYEKQMREYCKDNIDALFEKWGEKAIEKDGLLGSHVKTKRYLYRMSPLRLSIKAGWYKFLDLAKTVLTFDWIPTYTELDTMPNGWRKGFGIQMCKEIKIALKKLPRKTRRRYMITDIKEKYGELRWYDIGGTKWVHDIIDKYTKLSYYTCIRCGKPAHYLSEGWICPYCEEHIKGHSYIPDINVETGDADWDKPLEREDGYMGWISPEVKKKHKYWDEHCEELIEKRREQIAIKSER